MIKERLTGAPMAQLCQIVALRASRRWTMRAHRPRGPRPPWSSRPSWWFRVQMIASTRWRSQLGNSPGVVFVLAGWPHQVQTKAGEELLGLFSSQALVGDHGAAPGWTGRRVDAQQLPDGLLFPHQLGVGQTKPGDRPLGGADQQELDAPVVAAVGALIAVPGIAEQP